jgi:predicted aldo/keto reductase-like oxidoreductase
MKYRELGKTGIKVSELGMGCEGFVGRDSAFADEMFALAFESGVNCMDLYSPDPDLHRHVGTALHRHREEFVLQAHLCTTWQDGQYKVTRNLDEVTEVFERMLKNLKTDYVDIGMIHYVDSMDTWRQIEQGGILRYVLELKEQGTIRHIGISSHNPVVALHAVNSGLVEVLMFSINPCYDLQPADEDVEKLWAESSYEKPLLNFDPQREALYEACQRMGVGITVMKVFGGGDLLSEYSPAGKALTTAQCIHYALTRPGVSTVLLGARSRAELNASIQYEYASDEERDYASVFATFPKISWNGHCMYCGHCAPCPKKIDIAAVTKFLNLSIAQGSVPETVREHYAALNSFAGDCIACGACEKRCPFDVAIIENMKRAEALFGK